MEWRHATIVNIQKSAFTSYESASLLSIPWRFSDTSSAADRWHPPYLPFLPTYTLRLTRFASRVSTIDTWTSLTRPSGAALAAPGHASRARFLVMTSRARGVVYRRVSTRPARGRAAITLGGREAPSTPHETRQRERGRSSQAWHRETCAPSETPPTKHDMHARPTEPYRVLRARQRHIVGRYRRADGS